MSSTNTGKPKPPYKGKWKKPEVATCLQYCLVRLKKLLPQMQRKIEAAKMDIANLMKQGKTEIARAKTESFISARHEYEGHQIIEIYCELVKARLTFLDSEVVCPDNMTESVGGLVYAQRFADVEYLTALKKHIKSKYGPEKVAEWEQGLSGITPRFITKWDNSIPPDDLVSKELSQICQQYGIPYETPASLGNQWAAPDIPASAPPPPTFTESQIRREDGQPVNTQGNLQPLYGQTAPPYTQNQVPPQPGQGQYNPGAGIMSVPCIPPGQPQFTPTYQYNPQETPQYDPYPGLKSVSQLPPQFQMSQQRPSAPPQAYADPSYNPYNSVYNPALSMLGGPPPAYLPSGGQPPPSADVVSDPTKPFDFQPLNLKDEPTSGLPPPFYPPDA
ncbi:putative Regulator of Vps4 activity in the MVB pathway [Blattamonas nauphoetae]|uniref:Regulator of Vps4 activity in the MVB pathway n=1 Tax=Blattamonas nauphoetae TaxID=2049346 RepID=A0ABQ9YB87_9EUKA|nr:putative Regulator of Vps4 activity in the MVB pathway [Blattamonas nauphoetae]